MRRSLFVWLTVVLLVSCTITKRHYRKGFHVEWHHAVKTPTTAKIAAPDTLSLQQQVNEDPMAEALSPVRVSPAQQVQDFSAERISVPVRQEKTVKHTVHPTAAKYFPGSTRLHHKRSAAPRPTTIGSDDEYVDEAYALRKANTSMWLGIAAIALFFLLSFFTIILSVIAIKAGRKALLVNSAQQDPKVNRRVRIGIGLARFPIYFLAITLLLAVAFAAIALFVVAGQTLATLGFAFALVICGGLFLLVYFGLRGFLINPDFRQHDRLEKKG